MRSEMALPECVAKWHEFQQISGEGEEEENVHYDIIKKHRDVAVSLACVSTINPSADARA